MPRRNPQQQHSTDALSSSWLHAVPSARQAIIASAAAVCVSLFAGSAAMAQPAGGAATGPARNAAANDPLKTNVEDFWHYAKLGRYDVANAKAKEILDSNPDPSALLAAFEAAANRRTNDDLTSGMVRFIGIPELQENAKKLEAILVKGRYARRADASFIEQNIQRLITNQIGYQNGLENLRNSGEMAVPMLLEYLRDPNRAQYHDAVRRALKDMGRVALNPLVAATESTNPQTQVNVVTLLGDLGYPDAVPYLLRLGANSPSTELRDAVNRALSNLHAAPNTPTDAAFLDLAEKVYYGRAALAADQRNPQAFIWYWTEQSGLERKEVPQEVFGEIMAMRECEYSLAAAANGSDVGDRAMSLWLAANYKRQVQLAGAPDPTRGQNQPDAHYYGVTSGPKYLGAALARTINDHDSAVAYDILRSAQEIIGRSTLNTGAEGASLVQALSYPDRRVRFEAAFALAAARPAGAYDGSDAVVPLLAEALSQTGKPTALVLAATTDKANAIAGPLRNAGYEAVATTTATDAGNSANSLPAVDIVIFDGSMPNDQLQQLLSQLGASPKLRSSARLALVPTTATVFEDLKSRDPLLSTTTATDAGEIQKAIDAARTKAGALPVDATVAADYALRAAAQLESVGLQNSAAGGHGVYDLAVAKPTLLKSLGDERPEVVMAVGRVLAQLNDADAQQALLAKASDGATPAPLRISLYKSLAANAKQFGNKLGGDQIGTLETAVTDEANLDVRAAAGEARGALNLSADQAKSIILKQATH